MKIQIKKEKENSLLSRKELLLEMEFEAATPKRADTAAKVAETFKTTIDHVAIRKISNVFGSRKAAVTANIYKSAEDKAKFEHKKYLNKGVPREKKAPTS